MDAFVPADAGCGEAELCGAPLDEDCDGIVDEGCDWHFGRSSPLVRIHRSTDWHYSPVLSRDGRRLYFRAGVEDGPDLWVASRGSVRERFGEPEPVPGEELEDYLIFSFTLDDAERELIVEAVPPDGSDQTRLYRATRDSPTGTFGPLVRLDVLASDAAYREFNPHLSRDGTELFFVSSRTGATRIHRATRSAPGADFGEPAEITLPGSGGAEATPMLTRDGLTLFFARDWRIWRATRASTDTAIFDTAERSTDLPDDANTYFPFVSQATREIFFVSERPWTPTDEGGIWRARICRDGPCEEDAIACSGGVTSPDERHCYWLGSGVLGWDEARTVCADSGGELVSLHSPEERELVATLTGSDVWIGAHDLDHECNLSMPGCTFEWTTEEPFLFAPWFGGEPNDAGGDEDCVVLTAAGMYDNECDTVYAYACERELWPW